MKKKFIGKNVDKKNTTTITRVVNNTSEKKPAKQRLTKKNRIEKYSLTRVEGKNISDSFRASHPHCVTNNWKPETIHSRASEFEKLGEVQGRILELQKIHRQRHNVTVDSLTAELEEAREMGISTKQAAAMTGATMGKAKLHGLITDKSEHTGKNRGPIAVISANLPPKEALRQYKEMLGQDGRL